MVGGKRIVSTDASDSSCAVSVAAQPENVADRRMSQRPDDGDQRPNYDWPPVQSGVLFKKKRM